jgi:hypothetical protein
LPGGASVTKRATGDVWSCPNIQGSIVATANGAGVKQGATAHYDPFGQQIGGTTPRRRRLFIAKPDADLIARYEVRLYVTSFSRHQLWTDGS